VTGPSCAADRSRRSNAARWVALGLALLGIACSAPASSAARRPSARTPSVLLIFTDDQGWADLGVQGAQGFRTPNLDRLAAEGVRFTDFYVSQPVCSASRSSLLTGCYANRIGIHGALGPDSPIGIGADEQTLAELLHGRGYATAIFGKWHLGHRPPFLPQRHGFDRYYGIPYSNDMWPGHPENPKAWGDLPTIEGDTPVGYNTDQDDFTGEFTRRSIEFIREQTALDRPFFVYLAHPMPHVPLHASAAARDASARGLYGDVIQEIDAGVGRLLDTLEECGVAEDTLVLFASDNGPWLSYGDHAGSAGPLREGKGTTFEGGVRVPFLARWPGHIPAGRVVHTPAMTIDLLPTIAGLVGAPLPSLPIDGRDIAPLLLGTSEASPQEAYFFYYGRGNLEAMRAGRWKLHFPHGYRSMKGRAPGSGGKPGAYDYSPRTGLELYDLENDVGETTDLAAQRPEVVARLSALADAQRRRLGDGLTGVVGTENREPGRVPPEAPGASGNAPGVGGK